MRRFTSGNEARKGPRGDDGGDTENDETESDENADEGELDRDEKLQKAKERRDVELAALELAHEDAQFTVERTLQLFSDLSGEAFRLARLNAVVVTILVAITSQASVEQYVNVPSVASLLLFICSALFALVSYLTTTFNRGFDEETFERLVTYNVREAEYMNWILRRGYPKWIADAVEKVNRKERWVRRSLVAFIAGITTLTAGILFTIY